MESDDENRITLSSSLPSVDHASFSTFWGSDSLSVPLTKAAGVTDPAFPRSTTLTGLDPSRSSMSVTTVEDARAELERLYGQQVVFVAGAGVN